MEDVRVIEGDSLAVMPTLAEGSVDLIVADPPYHRAIDEAWDRQWATDGDYLAWLGRVLDEWRRLLKPNGSLYCFASPRMAARVECAIGERFEVLNQVVWKKGDESGNGMHSRQHKDDCRAWFPQSERIIFAELGPDWTVAYLRDECEAAGISAIELSGLLGFKASGGSIGPRRYLSEKGFAPMSRADYRSLQIRTGRFALPYDEVYRPFAVDASVPYTDVWDFPTVAARPDKHPCEKPLAMIEHVIAASSRPGALVLDPFLGSGTTAVAAANLGRRCVGIDSDPHWVEYARRRVATRDRPHAALPRRPKREAETPLFAGMGG